MVVERLMRPTMPIALGGAGGPIIDAPVAFGIVYDPIETLAYVAARTSWITLGTSVLDALFAATVSTQVISRPKVMLWVRRTFAATYVLLAGRLAAESR